MNDSINIDYDELLHDTGSALLVKIDKQQHWIPVSVIEKYGGDEAEFNGTLYVAEWFAKEEGLI